MPTSPEIITIVAISTETAWEDACTAGAYTQSTLDSTLAEVGFIHCSFPNQTLEILNRKFLDREHLVLLLINQDKVTAPVKYEAALSGRPGILPHIYGPLNVDAVYQALPLTKDAEGKFVAPEAFKLFETAA